jgi:sialidase-1
LYIINIQRYHIFYTLKMIKPVKRIIGAAILFGLLMSCEMAHAETADSSHINRSLLFNFGDNGSKFYRIPAIVTLSDGTLVAVADKRIDNNSDLPGRIDVVCRTSSDRGATWSPVITVAEHDSNGGYGDPALVVERNSGDILCIATHGEGLWTATPGKSARIVVMRSSDKGNTWSAPLDITDDILTSIPENDAPIKGVTGFATSGRALQTSDGRLMFVLVVRDNPTAGQWCPLKVYACYSDDGGYKWSSSGICAEADGDESKVVELSDGRILMSIRNRKKGGRLFSYSSDRGHTWSPAEEHLQLIEPACNGDLLSWKRNGKHILLHSICSHPMDRRNVTIFASFDDGRTWPVSKTICEAPSAYSALTILDDGTVGCFLEEEAQSDNGVGFQLWFNSYNIDQLLDSSNGK